MENPAEISEPLAAPRPKRHRWLMPTIKLGIVAIIAWGVHRTIASGLHELGEHPFHVDPAWLVACGGLYLLALLPASLFWRHVLRTLGQDVGIAETVRAYYVGNIGKYVPGKALVIILRAGLIRSHRVDTSVATVSIFVETLTLMASGSCLAAVTLAVWHPEHGWYAVAALGMMLVVGLPTLPPIFRWVLHWTNRTRATTVPRAQLQRLGYATLAVGWLAGCATWTLMALSQWASLRALGADTHLLTDLPLCVSIVTLSTVAGFLSFIPGGFGVRDIVMTQIAAPRFGPANGLASALLVRLTWLVAELGISAILYLIPWGPRATPPTGDDNG
jgi:uncharacterized membrane protein YbhN (UPF0104 family)